MWNLGLTSKQRSNPHMGTMATSWECAAIGWLQQAERQLGGVPTERLIPGTVIFCAIVFRRSSKCVAHRNWGRLLPDVVPSLLIWAISHEKK